MIINFYIDPPSENNPKLEHPVTFKLDGKLHRLMVHQGVDMVNGHPPSAIFSLISLNRAINVDMPTCTHKMATMNIVAFIDDQGEALEDLNFVAVNTKEHNHDPIILHINVLRARMSDGASLSAFPIQYVREIHDGDIIGIIATPNPRANRTYNFS
jgi:hypothetical protein